MGGWVDVVDFVGADRFLCKNVGARKDEKKTLSRRFIRVLRALYALYAYRRLKVVDRE